MSVHVRGNESQPSRETGFVQRLRRSLEVAGFPERPHILVGYSGGADSLGLLLGLKALRDLGLLGLTALHVDHGARAESAEDARRVGELLDIVGVDHDVWSVPIAAIDGHRGVGREEALRRERYRAFSTVADRLGAVAVAVAHHQRDQAETVLLHLLRGAGLSGATGMRPLVDLSVPWWEESGPVRNVTIWRPLLGERPEDLHAVAAASGYPIVHDASNDDRTLRRNAIRHDVLPVLEQILAGTTANLAGFAERAAADDDHLAELAHETLARLLVGEGIARDAFLNLPLALKRRVLRFWVNRLNPGIELSFDRVEAARLLIERGSGEKMVEIGLGWSVALRRGSIFLISPENQEDGRIGEAMP